MALLVTGGAGFIGSHLARRLVDIFVDRRVVVLDALEYCATLSSLTPVLARPNFRFVEGDICDAELVDELIRTEGIDTILHLAAQSHIDNSFRAPMQFTKTNVLGTHVLLEALRTHREQIKLFAHMSTDEVFGDSSLRCQGNPLFEPTNPYSATKASAEMLVKAYRSSFKLPIVVVRSNNVYGPGQYPEKLIPKFILSASKGEMLPVHGSGEQTRHFVFVEDVVAAFLKILEHGTQHLEYNISEESSRSVNAVAQSICAEFGLAADTTVHHVKDRPYQDQGYLMDGSLLRSLGWRAETSWEEGLRQTKEWFVSDACWWKL